MSNTLTLNPSGTNGCTPDRNPWTPANGADVTIINSSGCTQTLSNITNGCLIQTGQGGERVTSITLDNNNNNRWTGKAGAVANRGTYQYNDGVESPKRDMRSGTIDPS
jgi:hypothetical protein